MYNPAAGFPGVVVELGYSDVAVAIAWLTRVFGFRELLRQTSEGRIQHADLDTGAGVVMLAPAGDRLAVPLPRTPAAAQLIVWVDNVDDHHAHALAHGAQPLHAPLTKPWGLRQYLVHDHEHHLWEFTQHIRDVPPQTWGATTT
ncbi:glyoxalase [Kribbella sandramycini]|uniref:Glyoxalase n=1 Tax=Kribbella sandramycini TaxID=60450 RepID=A0A7Y4NZY4_9ACTN|nr:PhnB protein [Kribbella sandramycini]NOL40474.1 glyoxalase [Kribbella sandramycini]